MNCMYSAKQQRALTSACEVCHFLEIKSQNVWVPYDMSKQCQAYEYAYMPTA